MKPQRYRKPGHILFRHGFKFQPCWTSVKTSRVLWFLDHLSIKQPSFNDFCWANPTENSIQIPLIHHELDAPWIIGSEAWLAGECSTPRSMVVAEADRFGPKSWSYPHSWTVYSGKAIYRWMITRVTPILGKFHFINPNSDLTWFQPNLSEGFSPFYQQNIGICQENVFSHSKTCIGFAQRFWGLQALAKINKIGCGCPQFLETEIVGNVCRLVHGYRSNSRSSGPRRTCYLRHSPSHAFGNTHWLNSCHGQQVGSNPDGNGLMVTGVMNEP